jgi:hypothetical protein
MKKIEDLGDILEENMIIENRYKENRKVGIDKKWEKIDKIGMSMKNNMEKKIKERKK